MNSFYGGKQGRTYHIVQHYDTINLDNLSAVQYEPENAYSEGQILFNNNKYYRVRKDISANQSDLFMENGSVNIEYLREQKGMIQCFKKGQGYTDVQYGEYVIIDTPLQNNPENGLLYRRGLNPKESITPTIDYNTVLSYDQRLTYWLSPGAGAEYVGHIVGPQGETPEITLVEWEENATNPTSTVYADLVQATEEDADTNKVKVSSITVRQEGNVVGSNIAIQVPIPTFDIKNITSDSYLQPNLTISHATTSPFYHILNATLPVKHGKDNEISVGTTVGSSDSFFIANSTNYDIEPGQSGYTTASTIGGYRVINEITPSTISHRTVYNDNNFDSSQKNIGDLYSFGGNNYAVCISAGTSDSSKKPKLNNTESSFQPGFKTISGETVWLNQSLSSTGAVAALDIDYCFGLNDTIPTHLIDNLFIDKNNKLYASYSDEDEARYIATLEYPREYHIQGQYELASLIADPTTASSLASNFIWIGEGFENAVYYETSSASTELSDLVFEKGWLISIVTNSEYRFYAFDYTAKSLYPASSNAPYNITINGTNYPTYWTQVGSIGVNAIEPKYIVHIGSESDQDCSVNNNGIIFNLSKGHHNLI